MARSPEQRRGVFLVLNPARVARRMVDVLW
jgi:hypothetical protein